MFECPSCGDLIDPKTKICPFCGGGVELAFSDDEQQALLAQLTREMISYESDLTAQSDDAILRGGLLSRKSKIILAIIAANIGSVAFLILYQSSDFDVLIGLGIGLALVLIIALFVSVFNDYQATRMQHSSDPIRMFKTYFNSLKTGRYNKAYASVVPSRRAENHPELPPYKVIPDESNKYPIENLRDFKAYWKQIFSGPSSQTRSVTLKNCRAIKVNRNSSALVLATYAFSSYTTAILIIMGFFIGPVIALVLIPFISKKEDVVVRKLMIKQGDKWYIAEGVFQGPLDGITSI